MIEKLNDNEVFIFGSNSTGFHGAGSAGLACRGDSRNTWRTDRWFLEAMRSPVGSVNRIGKWAVYGTARGYQEGREGKSYAIQTIVKPGHKRSTSLSEIQQQLLEMADFAAYHTELIFLMTPVGAGLAGWSNKEMKEVWCNIKNQMPSNVIYDKNLYVDVNVLNT